MSQVNTDPVVQPLPSPVLVDPGSDKLYSLITAAVTAVANAIILFVHITDAQKVAILIAVDAVAALVAWIFISSHHATVQANAVKVAAQMKAMLYRRVP